MRFQHQATSLEAHGMLISAAPRLALRWQDEHFGAEAAGRTVALMASRHGIDLTEVLKAPRIPFRLHLQLLDALDAQGYTTYDLQALGRYSAQHVEHVVPGAGLMLKLASPARLMKAAPTLWRSYADFGTLEVVPGSTSGELLLRGVPANPAFCATMQGFFSGLLARAGGGDPFVDHRQCVAHGCTCCVFHGQWT